jgi:hypothetical protein
VAVISDLLQSAGIGRSLDILRSARFEPWVLQLTDPEDAALPVMGELLLTDCETGEERVVVVGPAAVVEARRRLSAISEAARHECRRRRVPWQKVSVEVSVEDHVMQMLRSRTMLG